MLTVKVVEMLCANLDNKRSMQTIRTNTTIIDSFPMLDIREDDAIEVRRMISRVASDRQYFIITLKSDVDRAASMSSTTSTVKPLAEVIFRNNKIRYVIQPNKQYPELINLQVNIVSQIECSVVRFMEIYSTNAISKGQGRL